MTKRKLNPHKSHARVSAKRSSLTTKLFQKAADTYKAARKIEAKDAKKAAQLYKQASDLLMRANKSGGMEGPINKLPNPKKGLSKLSLAASVIKRRRKNLTSPSFSSLRDAEKRGAQKVLPRVRDLENGREGVLLGHVKGWLKIKLDNTDKAYLADPDQIRVLTENPSKLLTAKEKTKAFQAYARKHGFYVDTVRTVTDLRRKAIVEYLTSRNDPRLANYKQNPKRKKNLGLIDLATNLQAADYVNKAFGGGRKRKNPASYGGFKLKDRVVDSRGHAGYIFSWITPRHSSETARARIVYDDNKIGDRDVSSLKRETVKRNPSIADQSKTFQGKTSGAVSEFKAANSAPSDLARIGKLVFFKLAGSRHHTTVPGAMVAVDKSGKLWIVGNRTPLFSRKAKTGEALDFGEIDKICYLTAKAHIENGKLTEYVHSFGEEGGKRPRLLIDSEGMPILRGGDYRIKSEGIVN